MSSLTNAFEECRLLNKHYGTRYFHAINYFPKQTQAHIHSVCAFDRIVHEMIHNPNEGVTKTKQGEALLAWKKAFERGLNDFHTPNLYIQAVVHTTKTFNIPSKHFSKFISASLADHKKTTYDSYSQLQRHCDATAGRLTEILCHIIDARNLRARKQMLRLARSGQMTKIICNIGKIYDKKKKCYFATRDLKKIGYTLTDLENHIVNQNWRDLLELYLTRTEKEIQGVLKNITLIPSHSRQAFETTAQIYLDLLENVRKKDYDLFTSQPTLGLSLRLRHAIPGLASFWR